MEPRVAKTVDVGLVPRVEPLVKIDLTTFAVGDWFLPSPRAASLLEPAISGHEETYRLLGALLRPTEVDGQ